MKVTKPRALLGALLLSLGPLLLADLAAAEAPVLGSLVDSRLEGHPSQHRHRHLKPFLHPEGAERLAEAKGQAAILTPGTTPGPSVLVATTEVAGGDGIDESQSFAVPPDGAVAVSAAHVVEAVNDNLSVWTKTYDASGQLSAVSPAVVAADLNLFFGNNPNCYTSANDFFGLISDPSLDYDVAHDRFMLSMISFDQLFFTSSLCIAVSTTGDPAGTWFIYAFPISPSVSLLDFPRGVIGSDGLIYITGNLFVCCDRSGNAVFSRARAYAFKTSDMYAGVNTSPRVVNAGNDPQTNRRADTLTPARGMALSGMYFVSASNAASGGSAITVWRWSDPFGSNQFSRRGFVTVSAYAQPPEALQLGAFPPGVTSCSDPNASCIATNDARNLSAYWFNNTVWGTHAIGCTQAGTPVACVQWYQLGNLTGAPSLLAQGIVNDGNAGHYRYYPSLAVDQNGTVALAYAFSSANDYAGIRLTPISAGIPGSETVLKAGEVTLQEPRYGDYASTAVDPHDHLTIWHVEEYAKLLLGTYSEWGTWLSAIKVSP